MGSESLQQLRKLQWNGSGRYKPRDDMYKRRACANCGSMEYRVSACSTYKQIVKEIGFFLDDIDANDEDHEEYVRVSYGKIDQVFFFAFWKGFSNWTRGAFRVKG